MSDGIVLSYNKWKQEIENVERHEHAEDGDNHEQTGAVFAHFHVAAAFPLDKRHIEGEEKEHFFCHRQDVDHERYQSEEAERVEHKRVAPSLVIAFFEGGFYEKRQCEDSEEVWHKIDKEAHNHTHEQHDEFLVVVDTLHEHADRCECY